MENVNIGINHTSEVSKSNNVASPQQAKVENYQVVPGGNKSKTDEVNINTEAASEIEIPWQAAISEDLDLDRDPGVIDGIRVEYPNLEVSKNKFGKTKISFSNDKYEYTIGNGETLIKNKQTGQMQLFKISGIRSTIGTHVLNYNSNGELESYQWFDKEGKSGRDLIKFDPNEIAQGKKPILVGLGGVQLVDINPNESYLGEAVGL